ncbi:MAG: hypothetical protein JKY09_04620 [Crocinitomicaceae bacterium]|nr:hypothetical protein [Crocinitomicaceae bacterium]
MEKAVKWTWSVFAQYAHARIEFVSEKGSDIIEIGYSDRDNVQLSQEFWRKLDVSDFSSSSFDSELMEKNGDLLGTAFYFLNCLWERDVNREKDHWGRSEFSTSIWKEFGHHKPFDHVNRMFARLASQLGIEIPKRKSSVFLSHDIDAVYSAWQEDGKVALKQGKIGSFVKGLKDHMMGKPAWFNFEEIVKLEKKYDARSTFFWIATDKKIPGVGKNADYNVRSSMMKEVIQKLSNAGASQGIHKSIDSTSLSEEVDSIGMKVDSNRYHYLKFNFKELINEVNESGLKMDASLGYAEVYGYRNGYSLPFIPFDLDKNQPANFVEVPLTLMDATFSRYQKIEGGKASELIRSFIDEYETNSVISILWHNTHFTNLKYQGYPKVYEDILEHVKNKGMNTVSPIELIEDYLS